MRERKIGKRALGEKKEAPVNCNKREDESMGRGLKELTSYYAFYPLERKLQQK